MATLAHQGGWDEALYVAVPLVLFAILLGLAKRRAEAESRRLTEPASSEPPEGGRTS